MTRNRISVGRKLIEMSARPWSKPIDRKFLNMKEEVSIDLLLKTVHFPLVEKYEDNVLHKNGEMKTISQINEEYKNAYSERKKLHSLSNRVTAILLIIFVVVVLCATTLAKGNTQIVLLCCVPLIMVIAVISVARITKMYIKYDEILFNARLQLDQFRATIDALGESLKSDPCVHSEATIKEGLLVWALQIVVAEKALDAVRLQERREVTAIKFYCDRISEGRHWLNVASIAALKFGVTVDRAQLFAEAEKRIKQDSK